ncbi:GNAT family N-acetyltransferase, partial [Bacillus vallismortis]|nr:GNAT family N-acetyltransferase [Bacillus vallismortis]
NMVTIGCYFAESLWGKVFATESVRMVDAFLFKNVNVNRIQSEVMPENVSSKKVLLKINNTK